MSDGTGTLTVEGDAPVCAWTAVKVVVCDILAASATFIVVFYGTLPTP